jgi:ElaB/YqjD/DUF883 family membrane-anchored ribosome-binding protein
MASNENFERTENAVHDLGETAGEKAGGVAREFRAEAGQLAGKAGEWLKETGASARERAADGVHALADRTRARAAGFESGGKAAAYATRTADGLDQFSDMLKDARLDDIAADAASFVKQHPLLSVGAAAIAGFALARALRSGLSDTYDD